MTAQGHLLFSVTCVLLAHKVELTPALADASLWHIVPMALASALRKLELGTQAAPLPQDQRLVDVSHQMIANPFLGGGMAKLFATHPPMDQRIARLQAMAHGGH